MRTNNIPIDNTDQAELPKKPDSTPVRSFATPWLRSDLGFFYVDVAIVGPVSKEPQGCFPLSRSEADGILQAVTDIIELLEEKLR